MVHESRADLYVHIRTVTGACFLHLWDRSWSESADQHDALARGGIAKGTLLVSDFRDNLTA